MNMKIKLLAILSCFVSLTSIAQTKPKTKPKLTVSVTKVPVKEFSNQVDSVSYAVGVLVAQNFKSQKVTLNPAMVAKGFEAATQGGTLKLTEQQCQSIVQAYMMKNQEAQALEQSKEFLPNKEAGEKFLAGNKKKDSIIVTESGLQYKIIKLGTGPKPVATDKVKTHYHGTLIDGQVFDSSVQRGEPISFPVNGVIPGWVEALQLMPVGSKFKLFIPQNLAYGVRGGGQAIKPYSALVFEVELLEIEK
jgi:FKBP-type peptidyl-prolyl cis-trans isomerase FklB